MTTSPPAAPLAPPPAAEAALTALQKAATCQEPLEPEAPLYDALLGALHTLIRLRLTPLQTWLLLKLIRDPKRHLADLANEAQRPPVQILDAATFLFESGLIKIPTRHATQPTKAGRAVAAHLLAITALTQATNGLRQLALKA